MLSTKDHEDIFDALLKPKDELTLVPVPDRSSAQPEELAVLAARVCPKLNSCQTCQNVFTALDTVTASRQDANSERVIVLCGSLYLIGHVFQQIDI